MLTQGKAERSGATPCLPKMAGKQDHLKALKLYNFKDFKVLVMWYIYALHTQDKSRIYIGMSQNPDARLLSHNKGKVSSTKPFIPWTRFFLEALGDDASIAREKEKFYKSTSGRRFLKLLLK